MNSYDCLTVLDYGESYRLQDIYINCDLEYKRLSQALHNLEYDERLSRLHPLKDILKDHYKCRCTACGKIHYYTESIIKCHPRYCQIPRIYSKNYKYDYTGRNYDSLHVVKLVSDNIEQYPYFQYTRGRHKNYIGVTVNKLYLLKCTLCGEEYLAYDSDFSINPPTKYGYDAYHGYYSDLKCKCREDSSSFQWKTCKLLWDNNVPYSVEFEFDDLYGIAGINKLRFDFVIYDTDNSIKALIECQGGQHYKPVVKYGGEQGYLKQRQNDELKYEYCCNHNIKLIRIPYTESKIEQIEKLLRCNEIL